MLVGLWTDRCGQGVARVSRLAWQVNRKGLTMKDTCGRNFTDLSPSAVLTNCLVNKLRRLVHGSPECEVIWKPWITPWGQSLSKPRAVVRRNIAIGFGLWPTCTIDGLHNRKGASANSGNGLSTEVKLALWSSVTTPSGGQTVPAGTSMSGKRPDGTKAQVTLQNVVIAMALWPSNRASPNENRNTGSAPTHGATVAGLVQDVMKLAVWSAIRASDGAKGGPNQSFGAGGSPLPSQVAQTAASSSSNVQTASGAGSLHPEFAGWEMQFPPEWLDCAPLETPSCRTAPQRSSKRISKRNKSLK